MVESIVASQFNLIKSQTLKMYKLCSSHPIHLTFLPDITHQMIYEWLYFDAHSLKLKVGVALKSVENNFRDMEPIQNPTFSFSFYCCVALSRL